VDFDMQQLVVVRCLDWRVGLFVYTLRTFSPSAQHRIVVECGYLKSLFTTRGLSQLCFSFSPALLQLCFSFASALLMDSQLISDFSDFSAFHVTQSVDGGSFPNTINTHTAVSTGHRQSRQPKGRFALKLIPFFLSICRVESFHTSNLSYGRGLC
jgi:hypothetical protein